MAKLLETQGLQAIQPQSYRPRTTHSRHRLGYSPNLLRDREAPQLVNELASLLQPAGVRDDDEDFEDEEPEAEADEDFEDDD